MSSPSSSSAVPDSRQPASEEPLAIVEKVGYGLGDLASNLYWKLFEYFQLIFYTDVFGIAPAAAGTMFFVTKLFDAVNDPIVGLVADRTRTAWGRFRPYLIWMSVPFALTGMLTFYTPDLSPGGKLVYAYITYTLVFVAYTAVNIPYGALMGVISSDPIERTSVSTYRFVLAFVGAMIVQKFTEPLVAWFGGSELRVIDGVETLVVLDKQTGFFWTVTCYACAAVVLFLITFLTTRERVVPSPTQKTSLSGDIRDLMGNGPWMILFLFGMAQLVAGWTRGSATAYYFTYYVNSSFGNFLLAGTVAAILGMLCTKFIVRVLGAKWAMILLSVAVGLLTAAMWIPSPNQLGLMYFLHVLASFLGGPIPVMTWAMYADVADYSDWKNDRRATGLVFAAATFSQKMGGAIGAAIPAFCLYWFAFKPPVDGVEQVQSQRTLDGIVAMMSVIPGAFLVLSAVVLLAYGLDAVMLKQIQHDLNQRKSLSLTTQTP